MNILQLNASARSDGAASTRLADSLAARLLARHPGASLTRRDLAAQPVAPLDALAVEGRMAPPQARSPEQAARAAQDEALVAQLLAADIIVIGAPMYNFSIPTPLKAWIDAIARPGATFRYTPEGPVGLVQGKTVYAVLTRGGFYRDTAADMPALYLRHIFGFLGITDVHFVYAEGMTRGAEMSAKALEDAEAQILRLVA